MRLLPAWGLGQAGILIACAPMRVPAMELWTIDSETARHPEGDRAREISRRGVRQRAHVRHELVHDIVGQDDAEDHRVALCDDVLDVVEHRSSKPRLELARVV